MTTTTKPTKVNRFYTLYATEHLTIDMDDQGLYCDVMSESDESKTYTVRVDESGIAPVATSCNCKSSKPCKHMQLVNSYYARIYKSNIAKHEAKQPKQEPTTPTVSTVASTGRKHVPLRQPVRRDRFASSLDRRPAMSASSRTSDVGTKGALNGNRAFSILR